MGSLNDRIGRADWKKEKHVPVIECPSEVKADTMFEIKVSVGKEIAHPNTTAHHISWIQLFFHADGEKFAIQVGEFQFSAHGEAAEGPDTGPVYTHPSIGTTMKTKKSGKLYAISLCNIHGLWESEMEIKVV
jgi:superoxide reductase